MADTDQTTTNQDDTSQDIPVEETVETQEEVEESTTEEVQEEAVSEETEVSSDPTVEAIPAFRVGDTIRVFYKITEGEKMRIQPYEGIVISFRGSDLSKTFTVRRIGADQIGVERIFPLYSPNIEKIKIMKKGNVRRAKLFYLRGKKGREAMRVREARK
jgi:large subunit ribosomal protein L19